MIARTVRLPALLALAAAVGALALAGCALVGGGVTAVEPPDEPVGIVGQIVSIERATGGDIYGSMLVEGGEQPEGAVSDKAMVTITGETLLARGDRWIPADDLEQGMNVRVWFAGAVAESYPVQGTARFIVVE